MGSADKDNELIDKYRYGVDGYAVIWPYDVDMEALMFVVQKIIMEDGYSFTLNYESYVYGTTMGWTADLGYYQGTGIDPLGATYNAVMKYINNEQKEGENSGGNL